jgi:hypothetical protein
METQNFVIFLSGLITGCIFGFIVYIHLRQSKNSKKRSCHSRSGYGMNLNSFYPRNTIDMVTSADRQQINSQLLS